jgi:hypothetical protein
MKRLSYVIAALAMPSSAWAQSGPDASHPAGYYVGYLIGIGIALYAISRIFTGGKKKT